MLEPGEIHLVRTIARAIERGNEWFASHPIPPMEMFSACHPKLLLGSKGNVDIDSLAPPPIFAAAQRLRDAPEF